jgi:hypothetical protein
MSVNINREENVYENKISVDRSLYAPAGGAVGGLFAGACACYPLPGLPDLPGSAGLPGMPGLPGA